MLECVIPLKNSARSCHILWKRCQDCVIPFQNKDGSNRYAFSPPCSKIGYTVWVRAKVNPPRQGGWSSVTCKETHSFGICTFFRKHILRISLIASCFLSALRTRIALMDSVVQMMMIDFARYQYNESQWWFSDRVSIRNLHVFVVIKYAFIHSRLTSPETVFFFSVCLYDGSRT